MSSSQKSLESGLQFSSWWAAKRRINLARGGWHGGGWRLLTLCPMHRGTAYAELKKLGQAGNLVLPGREGPTQLVTGPMWSLYMVDRVVLYFSI